MISTRPAISTFWRMPSHLARNTIEGDPIKGGPNAVREQKRRDLQRRRRGHPDHSHDAVRIEDRHEAFERSTRILAPGSIREIAPDFIVEDVWALPVHGGVEDFQTLLEVMVSLDPANAGSRPLRVLWRLRDRLGSWFGLGRISASIDPSRDDGAGKLPIPGTNETSVAQRLPEQKR